MPLIFGNIKNHIVLKRRIRLFIIGVFLGTNMFSQEISVTTQRYDNKRVGWNSHETILNISNVNPQTFGLLFSRAVDDQIYAQPLIIPNLLMNGKGRTIVFVATENNSVYAFDAEDSISMNPLWHINLTPSGSRPATITDISPTYLDFTGNIGITGTPVIDTISQTMYLVSFDFAIDSNKFEQFFHALDIITGKEKSGSPVRISPTYKGHGTGSQNGTIPFDAQFENQRAALMLYNGTVYVCWGSFGDYGHFHGWIVGYDPVNLNIKYTYNTTPDGVFAGIWMSGEGPAIDDNGYIYVSTGNGTVGDSINPNKIRDRGESLLKLIPSGDSLRVLDFFTPADFKTLEVNSADYGVDGVLIIPNTNISLSGSKQGKLYVVNTSRMGKYTPGNDSVIQILYANAQSTVFNHIHGTPAYYHYFSQADSEFVYVWAESDTLMQFLFNRASGSFDLTKTRKGTLKLDNGMPGAILSVSSNGQIPGTAIVWANHPYSGNANLTSRPGTLDAYDARDIGKILWRSNMVPNRDSLGLFSKFNTPVVANGRVYMATFSNKLNVYGLINHSSSLPAPWSNADIGNVSPAGNTTYSSGTFTVNGSGADIWNTVDDFQFVYQSFSGDGSIVARIVSQGSTSIYAKACVMIRESLNSGSTYAGTFVTPGDGVSFQKRVVIDSLTSETLGQLVNLPYWIKIQRTDNLFKSYSSLDGNSWTFIDSVTINMPVNVLWGLGVTAHNNGLVSKVIFDNVKINKILSQAITFNLLPTKKFGDTDFNPGATASSGLTVSYSSDNTNVATIVNGNIHINGAGTCNITAIQNGNDSLRSAPAVSQPFVVNKVTLTVIVHDTSRLEGVENPLFKITFEGFVGNDDTTSLKVMPVASCSATISSPPENYPISVSGGESKNYDFIYVNGTLTVTSTTTGIGNINHLEIHVYPNPASDIITISGGIVNNVHIKLLDLQGQLLIEKDLKTKILDVSDLSKGIYFLIINNYRIKLIKI